MAEGPVEGLGPRMGHVVPRVRRVLNCEETVDV